MILPIVGYGAAVLKKVAEPIDKDYTDIDGLVANMFETMDVAEGVGLAAPQVGLSIRLLVVDGSPFAEIDGLSKEEAEFLKGFRKAFINPEMIEQTGEPWALEEGCLSIPGIHEKVLRPRTIILKYQDEHFVTHQHTFTGYAARILQHEYDHLEGKLFTDYLSPLTKRVIQKRLCNISQGITNTSYPMQRPPVRRSK